MTTVLQANLAALAEAQPGSLVPAPAGRLQWVDQAWRVSTERGSIALHSRDPHAEAERAVAGVLEGHPDRAVLVVIGLGLGYVLDALERRAWAGTVLALEIEPDALSPFLSRRDWSDWFRGDRLRVLVAPDFTGAADCWRLFGDGTSEPGVLVNPVLARLHPSRVEQARAVVSRIQFDARGNAEARRRFGGRYLLNTLANLSELSTGGDVATLTGAAIGVPAVVVGAGPSLDQNLGDLRVVQEHALVIAVDTAARPLLMAGVTPHIVVAVDPSESNARHLSDLPPCSDTYLVAEASLDREALLPFRGRTFFFSVSAHEPWPWLASHGCAPGRLRAWGSVLTSAFDLAVAMGCTPVVFAGSDLAFTGDRPYCRGVAHEEDWRRLADWGVPIETQWQRQMESCPRLDEPGVSGEPSRTAAHLIAFRDWLVEQTGRDAGRRFVNATGAGILRGPRIAQQPLRLAVPEGRVSRGLRTLVAERHRPGDGSRVNAAAREMVQHLARHPEHTSPEDGPHEQALARWQQFASGVSRARIAQALGRALADECEAIPAAVAPAHAGAVFDEEWILPLASNLRLVPMAIPRARMEHVSDGIRRFRFRTTATRLIACAIRLPDGAVAENGRPLHLGTDLERPTPGEYCAWRDEFYFTGTDGSDPRRNGRAYTLLVPECVAYLESKPLSEVLSHGI